MSDKMPMHSIDGRSMKSENQNNLLKRSFSLIREVNELSDQDKADFITKSGSLSIIKDVEMFLHTMRQVHLLCWEREIKREAVARSMSSDSKGPSQQGGYGFGRTV